VKKSINKYYKKYQTSFWVLLFLDLLIITLHLLFGRDNLFFSLDRERNLPATYQSLKLIVFGLFFLLNTNKKKVSQKAKSFLLPISLFFIALGFDELLEIHENIYQIFEFISWLRPEVIVDISLEVGYRSSLWIIYYLPIIFLYFFWSGYWFHYFQTKLQNVAWTIPVTSVLLVIVIITELLGSSGIYSEDIYFQLITIEEIAEMLFATILVGASLQLFCSKNNPSQ
jgi:hypothetical protein